MARNVTTTYLSIWDTDIIPDQKAIIDCIQKLRMDKTDVTYPYNGICFDVPKMIKILFSEKRDIRILFRHQNKMEGLYSHLLVGGAVIMNREKYSASGGENENTMDGEMMTLIGTTALLV